MSGQFHFPLSVPLSHSSVRPSVRPSITAYAASSTVKCTSLNNHNKNRRQQQKNTSDKRNRLLKKELRKLRRSHFTPSCGRIMNLIFVVDVDAGGAMVVWNVCDGLSQAEPSQQSLPSLQIHLPSLSFDGGLWIGLNIKPSPELTRSLYLHARERGSLSNSVNGVLIPGGLTTTDTAPQILIRVLFSDAPSYRY